tara:strand:- start:1926 stop:2093 length:168 start_codon:yes stop_codon:yes gene_type:complete
MGFIFSKITQSNTARIRIPEAIKITIFKSKEQLIFISFQVVAGVESLFHGGLALP